MLPEDVETFLGIIKINGGISKQISTFPEIFYFSVKPPFKVIIIFSMIGPGENKWLKHKIWYLISISRLNVLKTKTYLSA